MCSYSRQHCQSHQGFDLSMQGEIVQIAEQGTARPGLVLQCNGMISFRIVMRLSSSSPNTARLETCCSSETIIPLPRCKDFSPTQNATISGWSSRTRSTAFASSSPTQALESHLPCGISSYATSGFKTSKASTGADLICRTSRKTSTNESRSL